MNIIAVLLAWAFAVSPALCGERLVLTPGEAKWVADHPVIRLGVDPGFAPFEFVDRDGTYRGMAADYIEILEADIGLRMQVTPGLTWKAAVEKAKSREIDVLPCVGITEARKQYFTYTRSYLSFPRVVFSRNSGTPPASMPELAALVVGVQHNSSNHGWLTDNTQLKPVLYPTAQETLLALSNGDVDAMVGNLAATRYLIRQNALSNIRVAFPVPGGPQDLAFAVRKDWPELVSILDKALDRIGPAEKQAVIRRWTGQQAEEKPPPQEPVPGPKAAAGSGDRDQTQMLLRNMAAVFGVLLAVVVIAWFARGRPRQLPIRDTLFLVSFLFSGLIVAMGGFATILLESETELARIEALKYDALDLALELKQSSDDLTRFARTFAITADPRYEAYFEEVLAIRDGRRAHPRHYSRAYWDHVAAGLAVPDEDGAVYSIREKLSGLGITEGEKEKLAEAMAASQELVQLAKTAMYAVKGLYRAKDGTFTAKGPSNLEMARNLLHGAAYHETVSRIMDPIDAFFRMLESRTAEKFDRLHTQNRVAILSIAGLILATIAGSILVFFLLKQRIILPLSRLKTGADALKGGDYTHFIDITTRDEAGDLARAFNAMADSIRERTDKLRSSVAEQKAARGQLQKLSSAVEQSPVSVTITDREGCIEYVNPSFNRITGYTLEEVRGQTPRVLKSGHTPDDVYEGLWRDILSGKTWFGNFVNKKKDGGLFWERCSIAPILDPDGRITHFVAVKEDITAMKEAQEARDEAFEVITSSIRYASRIQRSILPPVQRFEKSFPKFFILWEPRDSVGGDIYFHKPWGLGQLVALVDCTGHGVPGAFMSMIANGALDQAVLETQPGDNAVLLQRIHQLIQTALGQKQKGGKSDDGLELGLCYIAPRNRKMVFAGARFSLFTVKGEAVSELKGNKRYGIGYSATPYDVEFTNHEVPLGDGASFYMTSDGLIDQVGGEKRRSFGKKRFKARLLEMESLDWGKRRDFLQSALETYQGRENRRDDVSVIGFTFKE